MSKIELVIVSGSDREYLCVEIWLGNRQLAEVNRELGIENLQIEFYCYGKDETLTYRYEEVLNALTEAKNKLNY